MKGFVLSLISCIIFFVAFGISVGILGTKTAASDLTYNDNPDFSAESTVILSGNTLESGEWKIDRRFGDLKIDSSGINTVITCSERDNVYLSLNDPGNKNICLDVVSENNALGLSTLKVTVSPAGSAAFPGGWFGPASWFESFFTGRSANATLEIELPQTLYSFLEVSQGSGKVWIDELYANYNTINIGSGSFSMTRSNCTRAAYSFDLTLGSGSASVDGLYAENYDIDVGSGYFNISNLIGSGKIEQGSGSGCVTFGHNSRGICDVDMGSGNLAFYLPNSMSAEVKCDIGSGSVYIGAGGVDKTVRQRNDYEEVYIGSGEHDFKFNIDMGSGYVSILDSSPDTAFTEITYSAYPAPEFAYSVSLEEVEAIGGEFAHIGEVMVIE